MKRGFFIAITLSMFLPSCGDPENVFAVNFETGEVRHNGKILSIDDQILVFDDPAYDDAEVRVTDGSSTEVISGKQFRELMSEAASEILDEAFESERPDASGQQPSVPIRDPFSSDE